MSDIEKILEPFYIQTVTKEGTGKKVLQELQTYISNLLDSTTLENEKYLDEFIDWLPEHFAHLFDSPNKASMAMGKMWGFAEQYKAEQHKRIKGVKDNL